MKKLTVETAEELASKMRVSLHVSSSEPLNMKTTLRLLSILTVYRPLSSGLWGLSLKSADEKRFILVSSNATRGSQHFTIAHELFHLYYDENPQPHFLKQSNVTDTDIAERSANLFASALLMPRDGLSFYIPDKELVNRTISVDTAIKLEQLFGVSHATLLIRLKELKMASPQNLEDLKKVSITREAKLRGFDTALYAPGNNGLIIGDYGIKAKKLFDTEKISEGHYLELLSLIEYEES